MPPKKNQKLDREKLEEVALELIDAVTAEPLHPTKYIEVVSPDGKLRLFYNISTLIRIGLEKGQLMQPPHFREEMTHELRRQLEELEGREIVISKKVCHVEVDDDAHRVEVVHRHMHFQQIVDEFYLLSPAEVYVCPVCYQRWLDLNPQWRAPVDPLDALSEVSESTLPMMAFRYAKDFKWHMANHHWMIAEAKENSVRDLLCVFFSDFNAAHQRGGRLSLHVYWIISARYNVVRYNRIVSVVEAAHRLSSETLRQSAFPNQPPPTHSDESCSTLKRKKTARADDDPFLVDDAEETQDEWVPTYNEDDVTAANDVVLSALKARRSKRQREKTPSTSSDTESSSAGSESGDDSSATDSSLAEVADAGDSDEDHNRQSKSMGYIKPHSKADRLSYEERQYLQKEMERVRRQEARQNALCISTVRKAHCAGLRAELDDVPEDEEDWGGFVNGIDVQAAASNAPHPYDITSSRREILLDDTSSSPPPQTSHPHVQPQLLLDD